MRLPNKDDTYSHLFLQIHTRALELGEVNLHIHRFVQVDFDTTTGGPLDVPGVNA